MTSSDKRYTLRFFVPSFLTLVCALAVGCSLKPGSKSPHFTVNLVPKDSRDFDFMPSDFSILANPVALSDLNCTGLNIHGGAIAGGTICGGGVIGGLWFGSASSRPASFDVSIPVGAGATVFEAFGFQAASCPDMLGVVTGGIPGDAIYNNKVFRLGQTSAVLSADTPPALTVLTAFDPTQSFQCFTPPPPVVQRSIAVGTNFACAVSNSGNAFCWGQNTNGQLGNNSTSDSSTPVQVSGVGATGPSSFLGGITTGNHFACGQNTPGPGGNTTICWGDNGLGQLGNGTTTQANVPVQVSGFNNAASVSAGQTSTCASNTSGTVFCWGQGTNGQLGNNSTGGSNVAVQVVGVGGSGNLSGISSVAEGANYTCARSGGGGVFCWGNDA